VAGSGTGAVLTETRWLSVPPSWMVWLYRDSNKPLYFRKEANLMPTNTYLRIMSETSKFLNRLAYFEFVSLKTDGLENVKHFT